MRDSRSREIIDILGEVVKTVSESVGIVTMDLDGGFTEKRNVPIRYIFGNGQYWKDVLDELSKTVEGSVSKLPLVALYCPFVEERGNPDYYTQAEVRLLIACASDSQYNNEQRLLYSFRNILHPIYNGLIEALKEDGRFDFGYDEKVSHRYSENYSYGRYGAYTGNGEALSETIDAIDITNLKLKVKQPNCR